jgi:hypothetical protein
MNPRLPADPQRPTGAPRAHDAGFAPAKETRMTKPRRSQRELQDAKKATRQEEMQRAITEGRLVIRQMTPREREQSDARRAAAVERASGRDRRHSS